MRQADHTVAGFVAGKGDAATQHDVLANLNNASLQLNVEKLL
jgi:hypothetical protein